MRNNCSKPLKTEYKACDILPDEQWTTKLDQTLDFTGVSPPDLTSFYEIRERYDYYANGNLQEIQKELDVKTTFIWGYDETLTIAQVVNATYSEVVSALDPGDMGLLNGNTLNDTEVEAKLGVLRDRLPQARVTIYTYNPLVGVTSITDPNGKPTYYEYDDLRRLEIIKDHQLNRLAAYKYQYHTTAPVE